MIGRSQVRNAIVDAYVATATGAVPVTNDVLAYLRRPDAVLDAVSSDHESFVASTPRPHVVVGLSLGGIILVDAFSKLVLTGQRPQVDLLVTAGSQSPFLFANNALGDLGSHMKTLPLFLPWLYIWTPNDLLSFPAEPAFGPFLADRGDPTVGRRFLRDEKVWSNSLFPDVHSEYFQDRSSLAAGSSVRTRSLGVTETSRH